MYSQNNEDDILKKLVPKNNGYFVDIGACDPKSLSNSRYFAEIGWKIFLLEMNPFNLCNILKEYQNNKNVEIMSAAITEQEEKILNCYLTENDAVSTVFENHKNKWEASYAGLYKYNNFCINSTNCLTLSNYIKTKTNNVDIISIDVEGNSGKIAKTMVEYLPANCYIVEHDNEIDELISKFKSLNYSYIMHNPENIIFLNNKQI